jgi:PPOX class probable F420-dependent enzyme
VEPAPRASRPRFAPGYGIKGENEGAGLLPWSWAVERLVASRNYWISTTRPDGSPHAMPVWGVCVDGRVLFGTSAESRKGRNLARDPRVVVHVESGDETVIVEGVAEDVPAELVEPMRAAYEAKYAWRPDPSQGGGYYAVRSRVAYAWRESDFPTSATRYAFD